ncbi:MAG: hypothetical protein RJA61_477 [Candidatus Parcubacteria bacterium]|jgi:cell division protein FtsB
MSRFFQNRKTSYLYSRATLVALVLLTIFLIRAVWNAYGEMGHTREQVSSLQNEFTAISIRANDLSQDIALLETEEGLEKEIRKKFGVAKEGEQVAVIIEEKKTEEVPVPQKDTGFFGAIFKVLKNLIY